MDPRIRAVLDFAEEHYSDRLTVNMLAGMVGLSRYRFEHPFRRHVGMDFKRCQRLTRLRRAKELLADRTLSIKQVAARIGYTSPSDFSREFREEFGTPPSLYRRNFPVIIGR